MSDGDGRTPEEPGTPGGPVAPDGPVTPEPLLPHEPAAPDEPVAADDPGAAGAAVPTESAAIRPADDVIPPAPPETPIPDGLLDPPPADIPPADAVLPPPPPPTRRSERERPTPAILEGEPPAAAADDWSQPSLVPEVPEGGSYRVLAGLIFVFLFLLLVAAVVALVVLVNAGFPTLADAAPALTLLRV